MKHIVAICSLSFAGLSYAGGYPETNLLPARKPPVTVKGQVIQGKVTDFPRPQDNDTAQAAIVIPSLRAQSLLSLQLNEFLAPSEEMEAGPVAIKVPGNLFVPTQDETFGAFPVTISKETYSFYPVAGINQELIALSFSGPFSQIVQAVQNKGPVTDLLPLVKVGPLAFERERDWSQEANTIDLSLNQIPAPTIRYQWTRDAAPANTADVVMNFQRTPANRWMLTDLVSNDAASGTLGTQKIFKPEAKTMFVRVFNSTDNSSRIPTAMLAYVRGGNSTATLQAAGVPSTISGITLTDTQVSWSPVRQTGWIAVLRDRIGEQDRRRARKPTVTAEEPVDGFIPVNISEVIRNGMPKGQIEAWVAPGAGTYALKTPKGNDNISLVFVGTDRAVPAPTTDANTEPALFNYVNEIRFVRISP